MKKAQITERINTLNAEKNGYNSTISNYKKSLNLAESLVKSLSDSNRELNGAYDNMKQYYVVNGKTADNGKITKNKESIEELIQELNNTIIPSINTYLRDLNLKISAIDGEIGQLNR